MLTDTDDKKRCDWCLGDPLYLAYHDEEWGVPVHDDGLLFEFLVLEGAQAGLSWITILRRREEYRRAFDGFDAAKVARYTERDVKRLLQDPGIIRNRLKVESAVKNARAFLQAQEKHGSFSAFIWQFVDHRPRQNRYRSITEIPAVTKESEAMSKGLKKAGFSFVGPTICYAHMQATGMVNDHLVSCHRHAACRALAEAGA